MSLVLLSALLLGCPSPSGESGTTSEPTGTGTLSTTAVEAVCADAFAPDTAAGPEGLVVSDMGSGIVHVIHTNYLASCCLGFDVSAALSAGRIDLSYTEVGDPCDCTCPYSLGYDILAVPAGTYTVYAGGTSAPVTVL